MKNQKHLMQRTTMTKNRFQFSSLYIFLLSVCFIGCKGEGHSQSPISNDSLVVGCYQVKPVKDDSREDSRRDFDFTKDSLSDFLTKFKLRKNKAIYDSTMNYVTSFGYQKIITVNRDCFKKLIYPDSCGLLNLYFNTTFSTWIKKRSTVQFLTTYHKNVYNFGQATIFEYQFNNVSEIQQHVMYIILKEMTEEDRRQYKDYEGFVICSDGLEWKDYADNGGSIPLFVQMVRRNKEYYIPLYFDGDRFIPIGHYKTNNWHED